MIRSTVPGLLALFIAACAPSARSGAPAPADDRLPAAEAGAASSGLIHAAPERLWSLLPAVYQSLGLEPDIRDSATRTLGVSRYARPRLAERRTEDLLVCEAEGAEPAAPPGDLRYQLSLVSRVEDAAGGRARLATRMSVAAVAPDGAVVPGVACRSTGALEQRVRQLLLELLGQ